KVSPRTRSPPAPTTDRPCRTTCGRSRRGSAVDDHAHAPGHREHEPGDVLLEARGVSFAYGRTAVLQDVDLAIRAGEFVALVGPNGSGKSTLLRVLLGRLAPTAGT